MQTAYDELESMWKEEVVVFGAEENSESGWPVCGPRFEPGTPEYETGSLTEETR
jgi:hypothetical protein